MEFDLNKTETFTKSSFSSSQDMRTKKYIKKGYFYGYETSSGILSSATSLSSVYMDFNFSQNHEKTSFWTSTKYANLSKTALNLHNQNNNTDSLTNIGKNFNDKVLKWFSQLNLDSKTKTKPCLKIEII